MIKIFVSIFQIIVKIIETFNEFLDIINEVLDETKKDLKKNSSEIKESKEEVLESIINKKEEKDNLYSERIFGSTYVTFKKSNEIDKKNSKELSSFKIKYKKL